VSQTGEYVKAGQPMLLLYSPEFLQAEQEYLSARGSGDAPGGGEMLESARRRLELLDVTPGEIAALEESGRPLRTLTVRSHLSGYVFAKNIAHGMYVQPGTEMFTVVNLGNLWVLADVYEQEIAFVRAGQQAEMRAAAFPGQVFKGRVHFVYPTVAQQTRTLKVRLEFPNPGLKLRPGMYGDVEIRLDAAEGLVAPAEAVVNTGEQTYVFVARGAGRFEPRAVTVGRRDGEMVEVLSGLAEGDEVVTSASFLIDSESRLKAAMQGMGAMPGGHAGHAGAPSDGGAP
jgi:RND family efflux transporter MFP subunit